MGSIPIRASLIQDKVLNRVGFDEVKTRPSRNEMFHYVYVLFSLKDRNLYVGRTSDIFKRLERHNSGRVIATKNRRPLKLIHLEVFGESGKAFMRERELKYPSAGKFKRKLKESLGLG